MAKLYDDTGKLAGHALVEHEVVWAHRGVLWWKRWGEAQHHAAVYLSLRGAFEERYLSPQEDVDAAVEDWEQGRWVETAQDGADTVYVMNWLLPEESEAVAERELGIDVTKMRKAHHHTG